MEKINIDDSLRSALVELQEYLNLQLRYNKMLLAKRLGEVTSYFTLFMIMLVLGGFLLLFLSFTFVEWINEFYNSKYLGHLIIAGFYFLVILIIFLFRKPIIFNPIRKLFGEIMVGEESDNPEDIISFRSTAKLTLNLRKHKKDIDEKEKVLKEEFSKLGNQLTISNIIQTVAMNAYSSFMTTSNIVKTVYSLIKKFTGGKKKVKRSKKRSPQELDEGKD